MGNKTLHLVYIPFTGVGLIGYRGNDWFADRIRIFHQYTLKSLAAQTNKNFVMWLSFRPEEKSKKAFINEIEMSLKLLNIKHVITYDGLMYWDDKFSTDILSRIANAGRILRRCWRLNCWNELFPSLKELLIDKNSTLSARVGKSLEEIKNSLTTQNVDIVLVTRVDSDDMLHERYIESVQSEPFFASGHVIVCKKGLIHNTMTGELAEWNPPTNPPFHTIAFPSSVFFNPDSHVEYYGDFRSHEDVPREFDTSLISLENPYCVTTHSPENHISTIWNHPFRGIIYDKLTTQSLLKQFGL